MHLTVDVIWALKTQAQNSQNCFRWNFKKDVELSLKIVTTTTAQKSIQKLHFFKQLLTDFCTAIATYYVGKLIVCCK